MLTDTPQTFDRYHPGPRSSDEGGRCEVVRRRLTRRLRLPAGDVHHRFLELRPDSGERPTVSRRKSARLSATAGD